MNKKPTFLKCPILHEQSLWTSGLWQHFSLQEHNEDFFLMAAGLRCKRNPQALRWTQNSRFCSTSFSLDILIVAHLENINVRWIGVEPWKTCSLTGQSHHLNPWIRPQRTPKLACTLAHTSLNGLKMFLCTQYLGLMWPSGWLSVHSL